MKLAFSMLRKIRLFGLVGLGLMMISCGPADKDAMVAESAGEETIVLLDPLSQTKFVNDLPIPIRIDAREGGQYELPIKQTQVSMGLKGGNGEDLLTTVWGFEYENQVYSPGPTILATTNNNIQVRWDNELPKGPHLFPVDTTLHHADVKAKDALPIVIHLHGGHTEPESDGHPLAWFTQDYAETGPAFAKQLYEYDNSQEAATIWYHDHTLGMTRLNVYAGLAGFYLITDENERELIAENKLPANDETIEMVVADKIFTSEGDQYYPGYRDQPPSPVAGDEVEENWPDPSHFDEFWGDFIVVNGMVWPKLEVEPRAYRFRVLNGADTRSFVFRFENDMPFYQIGTDGGFLNKPVALTEIVLAPAERADILVDFSNYAGENIVLRNHGPDVPFKGYVEPDDPENSMKLMENPTGEMVLSDGRGGITTVTDPDTTGVIMRFDVGANADEFERQGFEPEDAIGDLALTPETPLRDPLVRLLADDAVKVRKLALFRVDDPLGRNLLMLGTLEDGSLFFEDPVTEVVEKDTVEVWEIYNNTVSGHPIHIHLVQFDIIDRQVFDGEIMDKPQELLHTGEMFNGANFKINGLVGDPMQPLPNEMGRKDTIVAPPGQVTRVIARFDRAGDYVWHCHLLSHEDYDMMRPFKVTGF